MGDHQHGEHFANDKARQHTLIIRPAKYAPGLAPSSSPQALHQPGTALKSLLEN
jgi:hypothetical protein